MGRAYVCVKISEYPPPPPPRENTGRRGITLIERGVVSILYYYCEGILNLAVAKIVVLPNTATVEIGFKHIKRTTGVMRTQDV